MERCVWITQSNTYFGRNLEFINKGYAHAEVTGVGVGFLWFNFCCDHVQTAGASLRQTQTVACLTQFNEWEVLDRCKLIATASLLNKCLADGVEAENFALAHEN